MRPNVVLLALLVVQEVDKGELVICCGSRESDCPRLIPRIPEARVEILIQLVLKGSEMSLSEAPMDQIRQRRAQDSAQHVGIFLDTIPVKDVLAGLNETDQLVFVLGVQSARWEILWHVPGEVNRVFTDQIHAVAVAPDV